MNNGEHFFTNVNIPYHPHEVYFSRQVEYRLSSLARKSHLTVYVLKALNQHLANKLYQLS